MTCNKFKWPTYTPSLVLCLWGIAPQPAAGSAYDGPGQCPSHSRSYKCTHIFVHFQKNTGLIFSWRAWNIYTGGNPKKSVLCYLYHTHHSLAIVRSGASKSWRPEHRKKENVSARKAEINKETLRQKGENHPLQQRRFRWRYTVHIPSSALYPDCQT